MIKKLPFIIIFLFLSLKVFSQELTISNKSTGEKIADVFVFHENESVSGSSIENGTIGIDNFPKSGMYIFQHPSFLTRKISYDQLVRNGFNVTLKERILQFDEVIVSANRWEQDKSEVAQDILSVQAKTIDFENPSTSADMLSESGLVFVQKSQLGGGSPMLRGFAANSVLLVVDGVRLNNAIYRSGNLQNVINIDPNALEGAEVIYGPGSVMYGSDAMGGVMDFHTVDPDFTTLDQTQFSGNIFTRYSSASNERTGHLDFSAGGKKLSYFGSATFTKLGDLRAGNNRSTGYQGSAGYKGHFEREYYVRSSGNADFLVKNDDPNVQKHSGYELFNTVHKIKLSTGEDSELTYGFYYSTTSEIPRYDRLTEKIGNTDSLVFAEWSYGPQTWMMNSLNFTSYNNSPIFSQMRITGAYQYYTESRNNRRFGAEERRTSTEKVDLYTLSVDFDKEFDKSSLYYGLDFFYNDVTSDAFRENLYTGETRSVASRYPDGGSQYYTTAIYANQVFRPTDMWTFNLGARFSDVTLKAETLDESASSLFQDKIDLRNRALNGMTGVIYKQSPWTRWNLLLSSGFRAPNIDDVGKIFEVDDQVLVVPNPDLKPEFSYNQELGLQQKIGDVRVDVVGFHSFLTDAIVRGVYEIDGSPTIEIEGETKEVRAQINAEQARIYGYSLHIYSQFDPTWAASGSFTFTDGYEIGTKQPLRHVPPGFGKISVIYKEEKIKVELYSLYNLDKGKFDIPPTEFYDKPHLYTDTGTPGWITLNVKSEYLISERITAQLGIENILDQHYRPYSSGISAPGRNIIFSLRGNL